VGRDNADVVRGFVRAFNEGDWDGALADAAPEFEIDLSQAVGPYRGRYRVEEARRFIEEFAENWDAVRIDADEFLTAGDDVLGTWDLQVRGRDGVEVRSRVTWVMTVRGGALVRARMFQERDEAIEACGLAGEAERPDQDSNLGPTP
jgi:ketosteroid isomerase-like protein